jgi:YVTN family beta-propeller protein
MRARVGSSFGPPAVLALLVVLMFLLSPTGSAIKSTTVTPSIAFALSQKLSALNAALPHVTEATIQNHQDSLTLSNPGTMNIFTMANGGNGPSSGLSSAELVTAVDAAGNTAAAIDASVADSASYSTNDLHYFIGGVGVSGFQYYGFQSKTVIPPLQVTTTLTQKLTLPESALVVVVGLASGPNTIRIAGIPGLTIDAKGGYWSGGVIGHAELHAGSFTVTMTKTNVDQLSSTRADVVALFAFSNTRSGFIDKPFPVSTIPIGAIALAYDSGKNEIFATNYYYSSAVTVISGVTNQVVASIPVSGGSGLGVAYDSGKGEVFVSDTGDQAVSVISDASNTEIAKIPVGSFPWGLAYDSATGEIFVANLNSNNVSVISDSTNTVVANVAVGSNPNAVAYDGHGEVYVTNYGSGDVSVISDATNSIVATIVTAGQPFAVSYDSGSAGVYVACGGVVTEFSALSNEPVANVPVNFFPIYIVYDAGQGELFLQGFGVSQVTVISDTSNSIVANVPVGPYPTAPFAADYEGGAAYDSGGGEIFLTYFTADGVDVISDGTH